MMGIDLPVSLSNELRPVCNHWILIGIELVLRLPGSTPAYRSLTSRTRVGELLIVLSTLLAPMADPPPGMEAWQKHSTPFDRVRSVSQSISIPRSASWIAAEAGVSESTACVHLNRLVEMTVLLEFDGEGTATYAPDPIY